MKRRQSTVTDPLTRIRKVYRRLGLQSEADRAQFIALGRSFAGPSGPLTPTFIRTEPNSTLPEEPTRA